MDGQRFNFFRAFLLAALMLPLMIMAAGYSLICGIFERRLGVDLWAGLGLPASDQDDREIIDSITRI
ncbi:hypothetical protein FHX08_006138 [Rhizobium sp. BK529]|uniref:hypothetical protein n=1 Tax=unclassified Rhizobium TaxID=2613769 RepID=UPI00104CD406|nr:MULTISPECIES: hypothetical protein [unclassified Rhizobium]MBB3595721.1 hypothetical protein [Rhizobium sp. BK529]TCR98274.1 hypothetical protein EV281_10981 [Rhizobium sp. BK418]